jgi:REP element-mobilizing transposase RayT
MTEDACILNDAQRVLAEDTIRSHCEIRGWELFAVNCRTNHVHVVVGAATTPKRVQSQFKAWCTRRLIEQECLRIENADEAAAVRENWWTERGSRRWVYTARGLELAVDYVIDGQDRQRDEASISTEIVRFGAMTIPFPRR